MIERPILEDVDGVQTSDGSVSITPENWDRNARNTSKLINTVENYEKLIDAYNEAVNGN